MRNCFFSFFFFFFFFFFFASSFFFFLFLQRKRLDVPVLNSTLLMALTNSFCEMTPSPFSSNCRDATR